jgi:exodeoxyribonuclease VII large subunit
VQGAGAASEIAAAIRRANEHACADVLIVCRGGGSLEDLWVFNEEIVARAVYGSRLPIVSGIGHESDFTICDFVADVRAPTPTAAAALVAPDRDALRATLRGLHRRLVRSYEHRAGTCAQRLDAAARRLVHPAARLARQVEHARVLGARLTRAFEHRRARYAHRVEAVGARLLRELRMPRTHAARVNGASRALVRAGRDRVSRALREIDRLSSALVLLNPRAVLERGYAIVTAEDGRIVSDARDLAIGDDVRLTLAKGSARATVSATHAPDNERDERATPREPAAPSTR